MQKAIHTMLITVWIITPIMMVNVANTEPNNSESENDEKEFSNPLLADPSGIENWQVHSACRSAMYAEDATEKQMGQFVCRMAQDMIYEQNIYHNAYITFFEHDSGIKWTAAVALGDATPPGRSVHDGFPRLVHISVELT